MLRLELKPKAESDLAYWSKKEPRLYKKAHQLIAHMRESPFEGLGSPEPLKYELSGWWSRRINKEHRLVYKVEDDALVILQCRYHY